MIPAVFTGLFLRFSRVVKCFLRGRCIAFTPFLHPEGQLRVLSHQVAPPAYSPVIRFPSNPLPNRDSADVDNSFPGNHFVPTRSTRIEQFL